MRCKIRGCGCDDTLKVRRYTRYGEIDGRSTIYRRDWKKHTRQFGTANVGPQRHAPERLEIVKTHVKPYARSKEPELLRLWSVDETAYYKAFRAGRQACFILAGIHLAAQRRTGRA